MTNYYSGYSGPKVLVEVPVPLFPEAGQVRCIAPSSQPLVPPTDSTLLFLVFREFGGEFYRNLIQQVVCDPGGMAFCICLIRISDHVAEGLNCICRQVGYRLVSADRTVGMLLSDVVSYYRIAS